MAAAFLLAIMLGSTGCQKFTLTSEEFEKQQRGDFADREMGDAVGVIGSVGYFGAAIGSAVAGVK